MHRREDPVRVRARCHTVPQIVVRLDIPIILSSPQLPINYVEVSTSCAGPDEVIATTTTRRAQEDGNENRIATKRFQELIVLAVIQPL